MGKIDQLIEDIKNLKVQGATNVAKACLDGMKIFVNEYQGVDVEEFLSELKTISWKLASARSNEPLARNLVRFVLSNVDANLTISEIRDVALDDAIMEAYQLLKDAKNKITDHGFELLDETDAIFTHCHSSTAEGIIIKLYEQNSEYKVFLTETRPRYQGRITAKKLLAAGIMPTMVVDSASSMFILSEEQPDVDGVVVGCDEILADGSFINKIGTLDIALACQYAGKPLYVASTLLKLDPITESQKPVIEFRSAKEVWDEAPDGLNIVNPSFDLVHRSLVTGYVTELGVLLPQEIRDEALSHYHWLK